MEEIVGNQILQLYGKIYDQKQPTKMDIVEIVGLMIKLNERIDELEDDFKGIASDIPP